MRLDLEYVGHRGGLPADGPQDLPFPLGREGGRRVVAPGLQLHRDGRPPVRHRGSNWRDRDRRRHVRHRRQDPLLDPGQRHRGRRLGGAVHRAEHHGGLVESGLAHRHRVQFLQADPPGRPGQKLGQRLRVLRCLARAPAGRRRHHPPQLHALGQGQLVGGQRPAGGVGDQIGHHGGAARRPVGQLLDQPRPRERLVPDRAGRRGREHEVHLVLPVVPGDLPAQVDQ